MKNNVKERPILFSTEMVKAIIEGRKTQTRRIVEKCNVVNDPRSVVSLTNGNSFAHFRFKGYLTDFAGRVCKYGNIGDRLWVRETFKILPPNMVFYKADSENKIEKGWKPSIHMPRTASRILLEITDIRVERLQDINEDDAIAEGVQRMAGSTMLYRQYDKPKGKVGVVRGARASFLSLWQLLNGRESLLQNPFVWVVSFKVLEIKK